MTVALSLSAVVELFADVDEEHPASVSNVVAKTVIYAFVNSISEFVVVFF